MNSINLEYTIAKYKKHVNLVKALYKKHPDLHTLQNLKSALQRLHRMEFRLNMYYHK